MDREHQQTSHDPQPTHTHTPEGSGCGSGEAVLREAIAHVSVDEITAVGKENPCPYQSARDANRILSGPGNAAARRWGGKE